MVGAWAKRTELMKKYSLRTTAMQELFPPDKT